MIAAFLDELEKQEHLITDFDTGLWNAVIETLCKNQVFLQNLQKGNCLIKKCVLVFRIYSHYNIITEQIKHSE